MKLKILQILLLCIVLCTCTASSNKNIETSEETTENFVSIFDEKYYMNLKSILLYFAGENYTISDDESMKELRNIIVNSNHKESNEDIHDIYGTSSLSLIYKDGASKNIMFTSEFILDNKLTYAFDEEAFEKY